jgi:hypothetical protein
MSGAERSAGKSKGGPMQIKYIRNEGRPGIRGFYYYGTNVYYKNLSATGKIIALIRPRKGKES